MRKVTCSSLSDLARSASFKFGLVLNPMPRNMPPPNGFWYEELSFHELVPARLVELKGLVATVVYAKDRVAYWPLRPTKIRVHIERSVEAV